MEIKGIGHKDCRQKKKKNLLQKLPLYLKQEIFKACLLGLISYFGKIITDNYKHFLTCSLYLLKNPLFINLNDSNNIVLQRELDSVLAVKIQ